MKGPTQLRTDVLIDGGGLGGVAAALAAVGALAAMSVRAGVTPHQVGESPELTADLQRLLVARGIELSWPSHVTGY